MQALNSIFDSESTLAAQVASLLVLSVLFLAATSTFAQIIRRVSKGVSSPDYLAYRISLLGPPRSGKTTAAMAVLDHVSRHADAGAIRVRGDGTIRRLEAARRIFLAGGFPEPTREDESVVYRFDYRPNIPKIIQILKVLGGDLFHYRVEMADFAGEHTVSFYDSAEPISKDSIPENFSINAEQNFIKWMSESDKCLIFIDCERMVNDGQDFVNDMTSKYMAFWERYLDIHSDVFIEKAGTPVILVFSKADVLGPMLEIGDYQGVMRRCLSEFSVLVDFMSRNARSIDVVAISVLRELEPGQKFGLGRLVRALLPRS